MASDGRGGETDDTSETVECENCGEQRFTWEACHHCGHKHWRSETAPKSEGGRDA